MFIMHVYLIKCMLMFIMWVFGYYCGYHMMDACVYLSVCVWCCPCVSCVREGESECKVFNHLPEHVCVCVYIYIYLDVYVGV